MTISRKERIRRQVISEMGLNYDNLDAKAIEAFFAYTDKGVGRVESRLLSYWGWINKLGPSGTYLPIGDPRHNESNKAQLDFYELFSHHCFREV